MVWGSVSAGAQTWNSAAAPYGLESSAIPGLAVPGQAIPSVVVFGTIDILSAKTQVWVEEI